MRKFYVLVIALFIFLSANSQTRSYDFNVNGSYSFTVPCNVYQITVEAWGAGAGGSNDGGGGGGAYSQKIINVIPGTTYQINVGRGGGYTSGPWWNSTYHAEGENSVFGSNLVVAEGGGYSSSDYSLGGRASASVGTIKYSGGNGVNGSGRGGGGGGSSASSAQNGNNGQNSGNNNGGNGGSASIPDGGAGGDGGNSESHWYGYEGQEGMGGSNPGGGGGQGGNGSGWGSNGEGGAGADGLVKISYLGLATYCPVFIGNNIEPITRVQFSDLDNTSSNIINGSPEYESFCITANVTKNLTYTLTVKGNTNGNRRDYFRAYIDWNQDGDFNDTGESYNIGSIRNSNGVDADNASTNITIPSDALTGLTKMRIIKNRSEYSSNPCGSYQNGQIEEYTINVNDANATISSFTPTSGCVGALITLNGTNFSGVIDVKFNGESAAFTIVNSTKITATVPAGAMTGKISVTTSSGTVFSAIDFTVNPTTSVTGITGGGTICGSTNLVASGTGNIYFQGTNPNGTSTTLGGANVTVSTNGTYYFRSFNGSCWSPAKEVAVTIESPVGAVFVSGNTTDCSSTVITASGGSGGIIYFQGTTSNGTSLANPTTTSTVNSSGTYYFRAKNSCGWGTEESITVIINPLPSPVSVSASSTQFCSSTGTILTATGGTGGTIYYQGTTSGGTSTSQSINSITVNTGGTYYFRARSPAGCWGDEGSVTVTEQAGFSISAQPQNMTTCVGENTTFSVTVNPTSGVSYQWFKEGTVIAGATSNTYTIANTQLTDASYDYYAVITDACGAATTNHVSFTVNNNVISPTAQPTNLQFVVGATSIGGTFVVSSTANGYLVVRTTTATPPTSPVDGVTYTQGQNALGGIIEYSGPENIFSSGGLAQNTTYHYWVYAYNEGSGGCGSSPLYLKNNPLYGNATTASTTTCGQVTILYWAGEGSPIPGNRSSTDFNDYRNWSLSSSNYQQSPSAPTECTDVVVKLRLEQTWYFFFFVENDPNVILSGDIKVHDLTISSEEGFFSIFGAITWGQNSNVSINTNSKKLEVYGNANIVINLNENTVRIGDLSGANGSIMDFKADVTIGANNFADGEATFIGGSSTKAIFRGGLTFGKLGGIDGSNQIDGVFDNTAVTTVTWNNTVNTARFRNVILGQSNSPQVKMAGSQVPDNILGNLTMNNSSRLFLNAGQQWNRQSNGGSFTMNGSSNLTLYGNGSVANSGTASLINGNNFPSGFTASLGSSSTVCYYGNTSITQKINPSPTYGHLVVRYGPKENEGIIKYTGSALTADNAVWTMKSNIQGTAASSSAIVENTATLWMGNYVAAGSGKFTLNAGGTLGMGSANGIVSSGTTGNVQSSGSRTFSNDANYIYTGTVHQVTGSGLPSQQRSLEINNPANVELTNDAEPVQLLKLTSGNLEIKANTLTLNSVSYGSNKLVGSDVSNVTVKGTGVGLYFKPAFLDNTLKELKFLSNATGQLSASTGDTLNITAGLAAGQAGHVKLNSGSQLTTNGNLTLKSNQFGTASISEIEGSGASLGKITGDVTVERYINIGNETGQHEKKWLFLATPTGWDNNGQTIKQSFMENKNSISGYGIQLSSPSGSGWDASSYSPSIKYFNTPSGQYVGATNATDKLYNYKGWMVFVRGDRTVSGIGQAATNTILRSKGSVVTGQKQFTIPTQPNGFASFGNPYASAIDMTRVTWSGADQFYVWDPNLGGDYGLGAYRIYTDDGSGNYVEAPGSGDINNFIQSGQAFFIQTESAAGTITFNESSKEGSSNSTEFFRPGRTQTRISTLRTNLYSGETLLDGTLQFFNDEFSNQIDLRDGRKMLNSGTNLSIKVNNNLLIVERKETIHRADTIFFNLTGLGIGKYDFKFDAKNLSAPGLEAWLEDAFTQQRTPVNLEGETRMDFEISSAAASKAANRFRIVFKPAAPLPVTFVKVEALNESGQVNVKWSVANEISLSKYVVMKSTDGTNFNDMADIAAAGISNYSAIDANVVNGYNYYRIRSVDRDGSEKYSEIVNVWIGNAQPLITVFPNPISNGVINLKLENMPKGKYVVRLMNPGGQMMLSQTFDHAGGNYTQQIPWDYKMAHGHYKLEIKQPNGDIKIITVMY